MKGWVLKDEGPFPGYESRVWGPFSTKKAAQQWAKAHLCECCRHPAIRIYNPETDSEVE